MSSSTHTADFQTATVKANDLDAVAKINVGLETDKVRKHLNIVADAPEIRIQDKTGSVPEVNATTMSIVADGHRARDRGRGRAANAPSVRYRYLNTFNSARKILVVY